MFWRSIRISGGLDKTFDPFCSSLFALCVVKRMKAALDFEELHHVQDLSLNHHWHVFSHKRLIGCCRFSSSFWSRLRIDVFSRTPTRVSYQPLRWPSGDITAVDRYLLNFSPHRFIWQKLKHDLWLLEGVMSMAFADPGERVRSLCKCVSRRSLTISFVCSLIMYGPV